MNDFWIMKPFSPVFFLCFAAAGVFFACFALVFRKKDRQTNRIALLTLYLINWLLFLLYVYILTVDPSYNFQLLQELPLHPCGIMTLLMPIALMREDRSLYALIFYSSVFCGLGALCSPVSAFYGYSIFMPRIALFYLLHFLVMIMGPLLRVSGVYKPTLKDIPRAALVQLIISLCVFGINLLLIKTGLDLDANYYFSIRPDNFFSEILWQFIPIPYVYTLPLLLLLFPLFALVYGIDAALAAVGRALGGKKKTAS